jgi:hypothetical protein
MSVMDYLFGLAVLGGGLAVIAAGGAFLLRPPGRPRLENLPRISGTGTRKTRTPANRAYLRRNTLVG